MANELRATSYENRAALDGGVSNMLKKAVIILTLVAGTAGFLHAGRAGTAAFPFLKIVPGTRPAGMGEAFTAVADDANALSFNPAALSEFSMGCVTVSHMEWLDDLKYEYLAMILPFTTMGLPFKGSYGFSYGLLHSPEIERTVMIDDWTYRTDGTFTVANVLFELGAGGEINEFFDVGLKLKYMKQSIDLKQTSATAFDIGLMSSGAMRGVQVGIALRNLGGEVEGYPLPTQLVVGIGRSVRGLTSLNDDLILSMDSILPIKPTKRKPQFNFGLEYSRRINTMKVAIRSGYRFGQELGTLAGFTFGGGFGMQVSRAVMSLEYAFVPYDELGTAHRMGLSLIF